MANEIQIRVSLSILKDALDYRSNPTSFKADMAAVDGPTPGTISVSTVGTDISLSQLSTPGMYFMHNLDTTNFVEIGIWDGSTFHAKDELLAEEFCVGRIARNITTLRIKADTAACNVLVQVFEK